MPKPKPAPKDSKPVVPVTTDVEAAIRAVVDAKRSYRAVGKEFGVSHVQVRRWVLAWRLAHPEAATVAIEEVEAEPEAEAIPTASPWSGLTKHLAETVPEPFVAEAPEDLSEVDGLDLLKQTIADQRANIRALRKAGNTEAAGRAARDMAANVNALARLEANAPKDAGDITIKRDDIPELLRILQEKIGSIPVGHDLRCVDCGRALRMKWGLGED